MPNGVQVRLGHRSGGSGPWGGGTFSSFREELGLDGKKVVWRNNIIFFLFAGESSQKAGGSSNRWFF